MTPRPYCCFCGRHEDDCRGGLWHLSFGRPRAAGEPGICIYCARSAIRSFGEQPNPKPGEPIPIFRATSRIRPEAAG